jgi:cytoskeletal protein RodZ
VGGDDGNWHEQQPVIVAAGVAGLVLLALLVWAVVHTSANSRVPDTVSIPSSSDTVSTYTTSSTSSTTYSVPSVQTSQDNPVVTGPTPSSDGPNTTTDTPTTTANPYLTTTTPNAGHI